MLQPGEVAVDATVGNGHDTLFLAQQVGAQGHVYGFDIQEEALARTRRRLEEAGLRDRVTLLQMGHEHMAEAVPAAWHGRIGAVMFNLGYLPGGSDRTCITRPQTTVPALEAALRLLRPGGVLTVVAYRGHPGGPKRPKPCGNGPKRSTPTASWPPVMPSATDGDRRRNCS